MTFIYSEHAASTLKDRRIEPVWVERTVEFPELTLPYAADPALEHLFRRIPERENRVLRVVFNRNESRVITAYFDRSMRGRV